MLPPIGALLLQQLQQKMGIPLSDPLQPLPILLGAAVGLAVVWMRALVGEHGLRLQVPFGPFLVVGALVWLFAGPTLQVRVVPRIFGLDPVHHDRP